MSKMSSISPECQRIAKIFKTHIEKAIDELGQGYTVDVQGEFDKTPLRILHSNSLNAKIVLSILLDYGVSMQYL